MPDSEDSIPFNEAKGASENFFLTPKPTPPNIEITKRAIMAVRGNDRRADYGNDIQPLLEPFRGTDDYEQLKSIVLRNLPKPPSSEDQPATSLPKHLVSDTVTQPKKRKSRTAGEETTHPRKLFADEDKHSQHNTPLFRFISEGNRIDTGETFSNSAARDFPGGAFIKRIEAGIGPKFYILLYKDLASIEYTPEQQNELRNFVINSRSDLTPQALYDQAIAIGIKLPLYIVKGDFKKNGGLYVTSPENILQTNFVQSKPESLQSAAAFVLQVVKALVTDKDSCNEAALREGIAIEYAKLLGFNTSEGHFRLGNNDLILYATRERDGLISYAEATQPENTQPPKNLAQLRVLAMLLGDWDKVGSRKQNILFEANTNELFVFDMDKSFDITANNKEKHLPHLFDLSPMPTKYSNFSVLNDPNNPSAYAETMLKLYLLSGLSLDNNVIASYGLQTWADTHCTVGKDKTGEFFQNILRDMDLHPATQKYQKALGQKINLFRDQVAMAIRTWSDAGVFSMTKAQYNCRVWQEKGMLYQQAKMLLRACQTHHFSDSEISDKHEQLIECINSNSLSYQELVKLNTIYNRYTANLHENFSTNVLHQKIAASLEEKMMTRDPFAQQLTTAINQIIQLIPEQEPASYTSKEAILKICIENLKKNLSQYRELSNTKSCLEKKYEILTDINQWANSDALNQARGVGTCVKYLLIACVSILTLGIYPLLVAAHNPALQAQFNRWAKSQSMLCVLNPKTRTSQALHVAEETLRTPPSADAAAAA